MNNVNITDSNFISTIVYKNFMIENTGRGILNMDDIYDILKQESTCTSNLNRLTNYGRWD